MRLFLLSPDSISQNHMEESAHELQKPFYLPPTPLSLPQAVRSSCSSRPNSSRGSGGKKCCDEADLLALLLAHSIVRRVHTIEVEVWPLGGDSFKVALDARRPLVSETKAEIARLQGTREGKQELYKVATRPGGGAVREDDAEPELLDDEDMELGGGEIVAMAVTTAFDPLLLEEERLTPLRPRFFWQIYMVVVRWCLGVYKVRFNHKFVYNCCWSVSGWFISDIHFPSKSIFGR
jgi:hypothetical protein